jgi:hypothetical protein
VCSRPGCERMRLEPSRAQAETINHQPFRASAVTTQACACRRPRQVLPRPFYLVTRRCTQRQFCCHVP